MFSVVVSDVESTLEVVSGAVSVMVNDKFVTAFMPYGGNFEMLLSPGQDVYVIRSENLGEEK